MKYKLIKTGRNKYRLIWPAQTSNGWHVIASPVFEIPGGRRGALAYIQDRIAACPDDTITLLD